MRINKYLAQALGISRREADELIDNQAVTINSITATLGAQVTKEDVVFANGQQVELKQFTYVLLNKPINYVCSRKEQDGSETIYKLLPESIQYLKTAGRLDRDSSGLILLTDDGDYIQELTHPKYQKSKVYEVELDRELSESDLESLNQGVELKDGVSNLSIRGIGPKSYEVEMKEGRNRQIRRTFGELGYAVTKLHRTQFGPFSINKLKSGRHIFVDKY